MDPGDVDPRHPPALAEVSFESHGALVNGLLYLAGGPGPHPTVLLLHGFPGNEKNLDLAQAVRRVGFNVLFFHYRGSWGSAGGFGFGNVVEDVAAALEFLRSEPARERYRVDGDRLALVGHSMGGFAALKGAALDRGVGCVAAIAPWDLSVLAKALETGPEAAASRAGFAALVDRLGPIREMSGAAAVEEILESRDDFDLKRLAGELRGKSILLIGGAHDGVLPPVVYFDPLVAAYEGETGIDLTRVLLDGDHAFSWTRIALIRTVTDWLDQACRSGNELQ
jgi:pimeloyl-ACP methyl ester carboxylesterase